MSSPKSKRGIFYETWTNNIDYGVIKINIFYKKNHNLEKKKKKSSEIASEHYKYC